MPAAGELLKGDTALVTGAGGGIGRALAAALAAEGAQVFGADLAEADLSRPGEPARLAQEAIKRFGRVSVFAHAASPRRQEAQKALEVSEAQWREMLEVNLNAGFLIAQTLGRHMVEQSVRGRIIFVTSLHAWSPRNLPHYSAAKAGQTMVMKELARALGPHGIRVNAIAPGAIPGGGFAAPQALADKIALKRFGRPEEVAAMAVAVLSERFGAYVTGTTIAVDGGIALHNWIDP
jgi:NAD(P)-dependent dehydrogenase (short-subunit alcohol dehydrogenase family)